uniref:Retrovirus-related Pol polyprotein from transposon TNT 1-94-like beta-barrel domain-containing protein n=1 Tax=Lygus hesperus TaxID=30085 RepID=A0A0A9WA41_LYGHE
MNSRETNSKNSSSNVTVMALLAESAQVLATDHDSESWYVDSGATNHISHMRDIFDTFQTFSDEHNVKTANGDIVKALGKGNIKIEATVNDITHKLTLTDVWLVPDIKKNLFSTLSAQDRQDNSKFISYPENCMF